MRFNVLLPAYNAERTLAVAVESVLAQTHRDLDLVLIDDGSADGTRRIMERFARRDRRVRIISHENIGMGASLNLAMADTGTEWVARMDADDIMMPERLERQAAFLEAHPGVAVASCLVYYIDDRGRVFARSGSDLLGPDDLRRYLRERRLIWLSHPGVVMRRRAVLAVGGYRPRFWPSDDLDLWNRMAESGYLVLVQPEYLMRYRIHGGSICVSDPRRSQRHVRWVMRCMLARRRGEPEPSLEALLEEERRASWITRVNRRRKEAARLLYKSATYYYATGRYHRLLATFGGSVLLEPLHGVRQAWSKVLRYKLGGTPSPFRAAAVDWRVADGIGPLPAPSPPAPPVEAPDGRQARPAAGPDDGRPGTATGT